MYSGSDCVALTLWPLVGTGYSKSHSLERSKMDSCTLACTVLNLYEFEKLRTNIMKIQEKEKEEDVPFPKKNQNSCDDKNVRVTTKGTPF